MTIPLVPESIDRPQGDLQATQLTVADKLKRLEELRDERRERFRRLALMRDLDVSRQAMEAAGWHTTPPINPALLEGPEAARAATPTLSPENMERVHRERVQESLSPGELAKARVMLSPLGTPLRAARQTFGAGLALEERTLGQLLGNEGLEREGRRLSERIDRERIAEDMVRENRSDYLLSLPEEIVGDIVNFTLKLEAASAIPGVGPLLRPVRAAGRTAAVRIGTRAAADAAQLGAIEAGLAAVEGEPLEEIQARTTTGMAAGAVIGAGFQGLGEAGRGGARVIAGWLRRQAALADHEAQAARRVLQERLDVRAQQPRQKPQEIRPRPENGVQPDAAELQLDFFQRGAQENAWGATRAATERARTRFMATARAIQPRIPRLDTAPWRAAAVRVGGRLFRGNSHAEAVRLADQTLGERALMAAEGRGAVEYGLVDARGNFLPDVEALRRYGTSGSEDIVDVTRLLPGLRAQPQLMSPSAARAERIRQQLSRTTERIEAAGAPRPQPPFRLPEGAPEVLGGTPAQLRRLQDEAQMAWDRLSRRLSGREPIELRQRLVSPEQLSPHAPPRFDFDIFQGGKPIGEMLGHLVGDVYRIQWIGEQGMQRYGASLSFSPDKITLGVANLRNIQNYLREQLGVRRVEGLRVSGTRGGPAAARGVRYQIGVDLPTRRRPRLGERGAVPAMPDPLQERPDLRYLNAAEQEALRHINVGGDPRPSTPLLSRLGDLYSRIVRRQHTLETIEAETSSSIPFADLFAMTNGSARTLEGFLTIGPGRWGADGNIYRTGTASLERIIEPLGKLPQGLNKFRAYGLAMRTLELSSQATTRGRLIETGLRPQTANDIIRQSHPTVRAAFEQYVQYMRDVLQYWADAGGVSPDDVARMFDLGKSYIPLTRLFEDMSAAATRTGRVGRVGTQLFSLFGSKRTVLDPIRSAEDYTRRLVFAADRNRAMLTLVEAAERQPAAFAGWMQKVSSKTDADSDAIEMLAENFATDRRGALRDNTFWVWRDGARERWQLAPELARAVRAMWPEHLNWLIRFMGFPAQSMKTGVTLSPLFQLFNVIRDTFDATLQSQYGFRLGTDSWNGFVQSARANWFGKASRDYEHFVLGGGGFASFRGAERPGSARALRDILPRAAGRAAVERFAPIGIGAATGAAVSDDPAKGAARGAAVGLMLSAGRRASVWHPLDALKEFARPFEEAARMGEFMRARRAQRSVRDAVLASRNVTVDFQTAGTAMTALNYITAFLNPGIQSLDRFARVVVSEARAVSARTQRVAGKLLGADPKRLEELAKRAEGRATLTSAAIGVAMPAMLFWAIERYTNDQEIRELRQTRQGLLYHFFRMPTGEIAKVPKPFLWGQLFGTGIESILDLLADKDPEAVGRWAEGVVQVGGVNLLPTFAEVGLEQAANQDFFFKTPIVPSHMLLEGIEPRFQAHSHTSRTVRMLVERLYRTSDGHVNISPARLEAAVGQFAGSLGRDGLQLMDQAVDRLISAEEPTIEPVLADKWLLGRMFARYPSGQVEPVRNFYEEAGRLQTIWATYRMLEREGEFEAAMEYAEQHLDDMVKVAVYEAARDEMGQLRADIRELRRLPNDVMSPVHKRQLENDFLRQIIEIAKAVSASSEAPTEALQSTAPQTVTPPRTVGQ